MGNEERSLAHILEVPRTTSNNTEGSGLYNRREEAKRIAINAEQHGFDASNLHNALSSSYSIEEIMRLARHLQWKIHSGQPIDLEN